MSTGIIVSSINDDKINVMCRLYLFYHHFKIIIDAIFNRNSEVVFIDNNKCNNFLTAGLWLVHMRGQVPVISLSSDKVIAIT